MKKTIVQCVVGVVLVGALFLATGKKARKNYEDQYQNAVQVEQSRYDAQSAIDDKMEQAEEMNGLRDRVADLENQLRRHGIEPEPATTANP